MRSGSSFTTEAGGFFGWRSAKASPRRHPKGLCDTSLSTRSPAKRRWAVTRGQRLVFLGPVQVSHLAVALEFGVMLMMRMPPSAVGS